MADAPLSPSPPSDAPEPADPAADALYAELYAELRRRAGRLRRGDAPRTLSTTGIVHESYLKLRGSAAWTSHEHFLNTAARAMRQVIVNAAEARRAAKRGGGAQLVTLDDDEEGRDRALGAAGHAPSRDEDVLALDEALARFERLCPRQARVVECRHFAGLSVEETAAALGVGPATVQRDWRFARAWLRQALTADAAPPAERAAAPPGRGDRKPRPLR